MVTKWLLQPQASCRIESLKYNGKHWEYEPGDTREMQKVCLTKVDIFSNASARFISAFA